MNTSLPSATSRQTRGYISEMLSELADLAKGLDDRRLECSIRLLALDVLAMAPSAQSKEPHDA